MFLTNFYFKSACIILNCCMMINWCFKLCNFDLLSKKAGQSGSGWVISGQV